ncbi:NADAR family protein [Prescottella agglutinans]|uniref:NAD-dependent protein-ADP-ribosyltransferase YbiA (DUF1768 family) n=1 Tax=Prescottella agglutinans TaxID=1644129 RepID=A0ABT6MIH1_9NOCA|nr:NADAR family protein [Prescottella agglutinans]MDH6284035.1 putative NAD-dependent protein-ADP-ribosyltransferase YbiA (DUF1768 family) [Prescottella agglutinans]
MNATDTPLSACTVVDLGAHPDWPLHLRRPAPIEWAGRTWPTPEHAFAAAHTTSTIAWDRIADPDTSSEAAHRIGTGSMRRDDWPTARFTVLREIVAAMTDDLVVRAALADTGDALLVAAGPDKLWGRKRDRGYKTPIGRNELGRTWMRQRAIGRGDAPDRWVRAAVTGHREHLLSEPGTRAWVQGELERLAGKLAADHGTQIAIAGMATGADLWWADAAHETGLAVWAYQPNPEQTDSWKPEQIGEHTRLLALAQRRVMVGGRPEKRFYHDRNALMLSDCDVTISVRDPRITTGGTVAALRELGARRPVITVDVAARTTTIAAADPLYA